MIYVFRTHYHRNNYIYTMRINLSAVTIVDDRKNGFTDVDNNVFVWPWPSSVLLRLPPPTLQFTQQCWSLDKTFSRLCETRGASLTIKRKRALNQVDLSRIKDVKKGKEEGNKVYDDRHEISFVDPAFPPNTRPNIFARFFQVFFIVSWLLSNSFVFSKGLYQVPINI